MKNILVAILLLLSIPCLPSPPEKVKFYRLETATCQTLVLENEFVRQSIVVDDELLISDTLQTLKKWTQQFGHQPSLLITDAGFEVEVMWNRWYEKAPGKQNNAENPVIFNQHDFQFEKYTLEESQNGEQILDLIFSAKNSSLEIRLSYLLEPGKFYSKRKIILSDKGNNGHFIEKITLRQGLMKLVSKEDLQNKKAVTFSVEGGGFTEEITATQSDLKTNFEIIKKGEFGQPIAIQSNDAGAFAGIEYAAATNEITGFKNNLAFINCYEFIGEKISPQPLESEWMVTAITPEPFVKKWFFTYVNDVRVMPALPYTLYNSWYDLRSVDYPNIEADAVMNEENIFRIWNKLNENMIQNHQIKLDAFVLDDGWDVYESDWQLRKKQFPHGLRPIADKLSKSGTSLGVWYGPTGGYSYAMKRIGWMGKNEYEVTGNPTVYGSGMLCLAGKNYSALFEKRLVDMVKNEQVAYFKWDGIQFACSEPTHGHPVGIHSRRAVMESVIAKCNAVRKINPDIYLNITSGTWLSPWWLKYANQIWMDAADYAFADVPAFSRRDNADTYRDYALYDDFIVRDFWFPIANLMTHGIIKGRLENISKDEPFNKFANSVMLFFARGVSMWELYISPDELSEEEWNTLYQSINWAKNHYPVLSSTFMVGKNPGSGNPYGYLHFNKKEGIIAIRNPKIERDKIVITLNAEYGIEPGTSNLVVEQVFPKRMIFPQLYSAGGMIAFDLGGFETAVFNIYPLELATFPLLADAIFELDISSNELNYQVISGGNNIRFLNPEKIETLRIDGQQASLSDIHPDPRMTVIDRGIQVSEKSEGIKTIVELDQSDTHREELVMISVLFKQNGKTDSLPSLSIRQGDKELPLTVEKTEGSWIWYSSQVEGAKIDIFSVEMNGNDWHGTVELWVEARSIRQAYSIQVTASSSAIDQVLPPLPFPANEFRFYKKLFEKTF